MLKESSELFQITMTNDELTKALGNEAAALIERAGFVLVPKRWRDEVAIPALRRNEVNHG